MTRILKAVLAHRIVIFLLAGFVTVAGGLSYYLAPKQEYPEIAPPIALITTVYPGALPEDVERLVTRKIEEEITSIPGYLKSNSRSVNGLSVVVVELNYGTDVTAAWNDLRNQLSDLQKELPEEARAIEVNTKLDETAGFILAVASEDLTMTALMSLAEELKTSLGGIRGISQVEIQGDQQLQVRIKVEADTLNSIPLSMEQIRSMIQAQAAAIPLGEVSPEPDGNIRINMARGIEELDTLREMILLASPETGTTLRLGQIADIRLITAPDQQQVWHNGKPAVLVTGYFEKGRNAIFIGREMQERILDFRENLPENAFVEKLLFQPDDITQKVNRFALNLLQGIGFVLLVVFLGMGMRNSLVVSSAIPLSIFMTLSLFRIFDIWIHQISIAALIIALGMLVDNAIVVSDAIQVRLDRGEDIEEACISGTRDVTSPVLTSTLTTIGAFIPLLMLDSLAGDFIRSIPQIVMIALGSSYIVSVLFIPAVARGFFRSRHYKGRTLQAREMFYRIVERGIHRPKTSLFILCVMIIISGIMTVQLGLQFFPKADTDMVYIDLSSERDRGSAHTIRLAHEAAAIAAAYPEVIRISISAGAGFPKFYNSLPVPLQARNAAQLLLRIDLNAGGRYRKKSELTDAIQRELDQHIVGGRAEIKQLEQADPIAAPVLVRISGGGSEDRQALARHIRSMLEETEGTLNVRDDDQPAIYEYQIRTNDEAALKLGITRAQIAQELNLALMGQTVTSLPMNELEVDLFLQSSLNSKDEMESFGIAAAGHGQKIPLRRVASVEAVPQRPAIRKVDGREAITVQSDVLTGYNAVNIQNQLQRKIEEMPDSGVVISYAGEREEIIKYFGEVGVSAIFAVMIVFVILILQFGNLRLPLLILLTIPFSAMGSIAGLWIFGQPLSFTALLGMVSLFGIVVNNAIILVDYIQYEIRQGQEPLAACRHAVALRLRPILLTTATTVMGLLPLILSGSELFMPMAISLMAGLILSTFLTLVILPVLYLFSERLTGNTID